MASGDLIVKVADKDTLDRTYANENDRTGTSHQNPASEKNASDKRAKRET